MAKIKEIARLYRLIKYLKILWLILHKFKMYYGNNLDTNLIHTIICRGFGRTRYWYEVKTYVGSYAYENEQESICMILTSYIYLHAFIFPLFYLQSLTKYVETDLQNQIKSDFYGKFNSWFCSIALRYCQNLFWKGD